MDTIVMGTTAAALRFLRTLGEALRGRPARMALLTFLGWGSQMACMYSSPKNAAIWTRPQLEQWSIDADRTNTWRGWLIYQGSDSSFHRFMGRYMDEWVWFKVARSEVELREVLPYEQAPKGALGYYYVDPKQDFAVVKRIERHE